MSTPEKRELLAQEKDRADGNWDALERVKREWAETREQLALARSFQANYEHATAIERSEAAAQLAETREIARELAEALRTAIALLEGGTETDRIILGDACRALRARRRLGKG
jgi:hypothetical protein